MKFYAKIDYSNKILPCSEFDYDVLLKVTKNHTVAIEIKKERNAKFHRKFFVLINLLFDNQESYQNIEDYRKDLLIASGFYEEKTNFFTGEMKLEAKSISFSNMDDLEFSEVYKKVIDTALQFIPMDRVMLIEEIEKNF